MVRILSKVEEVHKLVSSDDKYLFSCKWHCYTSLTSIFSKECFFPIGAPFPDFYPGGAGIFEDDTIISEDSPRITESSKDVQSLPKTSEVFVRRPRSAEGEVIEKTLRADVSW